MLKCVICALTDYVCLRPFAHILEPMITATPNTATPLNPVPIPVLSFSYKTLRNICPSYAARVTRVLNAVPSVTRPKANAFVAEAMLRRDML